MHDGCVDVFGRCVFFPVCTAVGWHSAVLSIFAVYVPFCGCNCILVIPSLFTGDCLDSFSGSKVAAAPMQHPCTSCAHTGE